MSTIEVKKLPTLDEIRKFCSDNNIDAEMTVSPEGNLDLGITKQGDILKVADFLRSASVE